MSLNCDCIVRYPTGYTGRNCIESYLGVTEDRSKDCVSLTKPGPEPFPVMSSTQGPDNGKMSAAIPVEGH